MLYIGVTNDVKNRTLEHKRGVHDGFSKRYGCTKLVCYEEYNWIQDAIGREKLLKGGSRQAKVDLVNQDNPDWNDLSDGWYD